MHGELGGGAGEEAEGEVLKELALSLLLGGGGAIDVGLAGFAALDEAFLGHDLEDLEDRGIAEGTAGIDGVEEVTDGGLAELPECGEELEFYVGGFRKGLGGRLHIREPIRRCS